LWILDPPAQDFDPHAIVAMNKTKNGYGRVEDFLLADRDGIMLVRKQPMP
jgi:hypothetical protein